MSEMMISVDIGPSLSALCGSEAAATVVAQAQSAAQPPSADAVAAFQSAMSSLVAENREVQVALEKVVPLPLGVPVVPKETTPVVPAPVVSAPVAEAATVREVPAPETKPVVAPEVKPVVASKPLVEVTPEIVREFAEVIAPLVAENREVQVAVEKVVPLPLEVPVVPKETAPVVPAPVVSAPVVEAATVRDAPAPVAEAVTVRKSKAPAPELPDAGIVIQGAPVMPQPQVDVSVRPVASPIAVDGVSAAVAAQRTAPTPSEVLIAAAEAVADTIMVTPGLLAGEGQIRVQLRPDVLEGTEIRLNVTGRTIAVEFLPQTADMGVLIQRCLPQLEQHLAARIHSFTIAATVGTGRRRKA